MGIASINLPEPDIIEQQTALGVFQGFERDFISRLQRYLPILDMFSVPIDFDAKLAPLEFDHRFGPFIEFEPGFRVLDPLSA